MARQRQSVYDLKLTDAELKAPIRSVMLWFRRAAHFAQANNPGGVWPTITISPRSDQWDEWREYFERHVGQVPFTMRMMIEDSPGAPASFTVPAEFPVIFDQTFRPDPFWRPAPARVAQRVEHGGSLEDLRRRFGPCWGIKQLSGLPRHHKPYQSLTDAELTKIYGPRHDEVNVDPGEARPDTIRRGES